MSLALAVPAATSAAPTSLKTKLGKVTVKRGQASLKPSRAGMKRIRARAHAAGSSLGKVPRCARRLELGGLPFPLLRDRGGRLAPVGYRGRKGRGARKLVRTIRCVLNTLLRPYELVFTYLDSVSSGNGAAACPLLIEAERIRVGGAACPGYIEENGAAVAARIPELVVVNFESLHKRAPGEALVILHRPREPVLLGLEVATRRYWRISDTSALFPPGR